MSKKMKHVYSFKGESFEIEGKLVDYFKDLTALFSELSDHPNYDELETKHPKAIQLLGVMP
jgi:hypothetical protein